MVQIIREPGVGENLGNAFGQGINQALQLLAQQKLGQYQQQQNQQRNFQGLLALGYLPEQAQQLAPFSESLLQPIIKQKLQEPSNLAYAQALSGLIENNQNPLPSNVGVSAKQATELAKIGIKQKEFKQKAQQHIEKLAAPVLKKIEESAAPARKIVDYAKEALNLLDTDEIITGPVGKFLPTWLQSSEGQQFETLINQLVTQQAQLGKGVPSETRLKLEQLSKPNVSQNPVAIKKLLEGIINNKETNKLIAADLARQELEEQHEQLPKNYKSLIQKRTNEILKESKKKETQREFSDLPPAAEYDGEVFENPATGQEVISQNGEWVTLQKGR